MRKMKIFKSVSNGPDQGIDLGVVDASGARWLVSCKHYAHSDKPVPHDKESGIIERIIAWDCKGFIGFYTTVPTATLAQQITSAGKLGFQVETYTKEMIEADLLGSSIGTIIAARYFPKSMTNHYRQLIATLDEFKVNDVQLVDGEARLGNIRQFVASYSPVEIEQVKIELAYMQNLRATARQHQPYFARAVQDAVALGAQFFQQTSGLPDYFCGHSPTWDAYELGNERSLEQIYFVAAVWSFWDWRQAHDDLAKALTIRAFSHLGEIRNQNDLQALVDDEEYSESLESHKSRGLLTIGWISQKMPEGKRDILGRLFLFGQV